ncbi:hypothetical protein [Sphingobium boeckii]|uniref:Uncharacterized protein n=1 Tax=Sphingobium boeckii TaxID=1082345 RepID=A0A7W9EHK1_9SPHN|nr:hypothetical protein [Sphingobium boeckii]MBB5687861.1 hypothetical protein [Sphingobium boeckii]
MNETVMTRSNTADDAAQAFEGMRREIFSQRGEMALLMRKVEEVLLRDDIKIPDYTDTLAVTNEILSKQTKTIATLAGSPMLKLLPDDYQTQMESARSKEREALRGVTAAAVKAFDDAAKSVSATLVQVHSVRQQRQLMGAAAVFGAALWATGSWLIS